MNELNLSKCNLAQTATVSHTHTLGVFPPGKKKRQRFVVVDDAGAVTCFEMKRGEAVVAFAYATPSGEPIQNLTLNRNPEKRDRLFASQVPYGGEYEMGVLCNLNFSVGYCSLLRSKESSAFEVHLFVTKKDTKKDNCITLSD